MISCKYGHFSEDGKEYIITNPNTPKPWSNIISNGNYSFLITQTGGGYSWGKNAIENRITRFYQDSIRDNWGKYIFIRDDDTGEVWSFTYKPTHKIGDDYTVIHGMGYTIFKQTYRDIESCLKVYISSNDSVEFFEITLKNLSNKLRKISIFTYFELCLGSFPDEFREFHKLFMESKFLKENNSLICYKNFWEIPNDYGEFNNRNWEHIFFLTSTENIVSYETCKKNFLGMYRDLSFPKALENIKLSNNTGKNLDMVACIQNSFVFKYKESKEVCLTMGICSDEEELKCYLSKYKDVDSIKIEHEKFKKNLSKYIYKEVETPSKSLNFMVNTWSKYQTIMCRILGKASYYQVNKGIGYRDNLQDIMIYFGDDYVLARKHILSHARMQFKNGDSFHYFLNISGIGENNNSSDDSLWFVYVTTNYIKETGDLAILNEEIAYVDDESYESLYFHLKRCIKRAIDFISTKGLLLIRNNDWDDSLNFIGKNLKGESIWGSEFLYLILNEFKEIAILMKDYKFLEYIEKHINILHKGVNNFGFDGKWFIRAISDNGDVLGSYNTDKRIFLITQAWGVISNISSKDILFSVMDEVDKNLDNKYGLSILSKPYSKVCETIGQITRYPEGVRENGSIYYHVAVWSILAYIMIGDGDRAFEIFENICPMNKSKEIDIYELEPYVMPSSVEGVCSKNFGRGNWSFNTGSSVWLYRILTNYMIGVRNTLEGILINPCVPNTWDSFSIFKKFKYDNYDISFKRGDSFSIMVDDVFIEGNIIKYFNDGKSHKVNVTIC